MLDVESFAALLSDCYQRCWLVAAAVTGDRVEADDIVQEASIIALRKLAEFKAGTNFTAWISQIVRLTAHNHNKKVGRRSIVATDPAMIDQTGVAATASVMQGSVSISDHGQLADDQSDFDDEVRNALNKISDDARACLLLRVVHRMTYREIAETLQLPEGTAMSHVHRAKQSMRQHLNQRREHSLPGPKNQP